MTGLVLGILTGLSFVVAFSESMLIPALPTIEAQYAASPTQGAWVAGVFLLVGAVSVPLVGKLGDVYGRKRMLVIVLGIFSASALFNGFSWSLESLLAFRALEGVGLAMFPLAFALIHDELPGRRLPTGTALIAAMNSVGTTLGLFLGAVISDQFGWQANYRVFAPIAVGLTIAFAFLAVEAASREEESVDYVGASFLAIGIGLVLVGLTEGPLLGWTSIATILLFVVGGAMLGVFVLQELRTKEPLMDLRLPRIGSMMKTNVLMFVAGACFYFGFEVVIYFTEGPEPGFAVSVTEAGLIMLPGAVFMIAFALLSSPLMRRYGIRFPELLSLVLFLAGFSSFLAFHATELQVAIGFIPIVVGVAMLFNCVVNAILALAPPKKVGAQNGVLSVFQYVGQSMASAIAGAALVSFLSPTTLEPTGAAYAFVCVAGIVTAAIGLGVLFTIPSIPLPAADASA